MKAIPGWAYVLIGVFMAVISKVVEAKKEPGAFALFFWAGIVFIVIGIGKFAYNAVFKKNQGAESFAEQNIPTRPAARHHQTQASYQPSPSMQPPNDFSQGNHHVQNVGSNPVQHASIIACPSCGTRHYDYAHYCMRCGTRIKPR